ncbi:ABC transporter permease [Komagataeibacter rhaeticus]|uniref:ABC transporter permease n=1 Tax=Komagataeibacter rhaeticus TaxID=215221 RepID=A0A858JLS3_9PROT|nr:ABC transporter permease [Komagataeibacter xylinus]EGG77376.1 putative ABC transporter permease protein [Gluconacetobacter sp. SXCC-1]PYD53901.1 ABC transporter permease [Komagataeibacter rhaeticus]QIP37100.1 ABC transporter permease [Komagataeibacter rhaeticus]
MERLVNTSVNGAPQWHLQPEANRTLVTLSGNWIAQEGRIPAFPETGLKDVPRGAALEFDTGRLGRWDTSLISFLWELKRSAREAHVDVHIDTLPESAHKLLDLLPEIPPEPAPPTPHHFAPVAAVGQFTLDTLNEIGCVSEMGAAAARGGIAALVGRGMMRTVDLMSDLAAAGPAALLIVGVVNFLVGAILAFVGSVELHKFAADIYVASLVAIAMVREMSAVMTAIIMAGRTGGAYAARISTMQANEEIDALQVFGIPVASYLILPSVLALGFTMPLLYLYGCLIGMLGGFVVSFIMLHVSPLGYFHETLQALPLDQFTFGFIKSLVFGTFVGLTSCRIGLKAGRSAADVGIAATKAVVVGIVGVIALDAVFAVIANVIGI